MKRLVDYRNAWKLASFVRLVRTRPTWQAVTGDTDALAILPVGDDDWEVTLLSGAADLMRDVAEEAFERAMHDQLFSGVPSLGAAAMRAHEAAGEVLVAQARLAQPQGTPVGHVRVAEHEDDDEYEVADLDALARAVAVIGERRLAAERRREPGDLARLAWLGAVAADPMPLTCTFKLAHRQEMTLSGYASPMSTHCVAVGEGTLRAFARGLEQARSPHLIAIDGASGDATITDRDGLPLLALAAYELCGERVWDLGESNAQGDAWRATRIATRALAPKASEARRPARR